MIVLKTYRVGIDLGGTNIKVGIVDENHQILVKLSCSTQAQRPWKQVADDMVHLALQAMEQAGISLDETAGVGVGCPGIIDAENGEVVYSNNLAGWEYLPLGEFLSEQLKLPVKISNDANCAALGECMAGAAKGSTNAVLLTLGTGVGSGIVWNGKVFEGGAGGMELGHTMLICGGEKCTCGRNGCIETYCSATALIRQAKDAAKRFPESQLNSLCRQDLNNMNGKIPFDAAAAGDQVAQAVIHQYIEYLGEAITDVVNIFRPQVVLISGGISREGQVLTEPLNAYVQENAFGGRHLKTPPVRIASLGSDAGIIGAACLVSL